MTLKILVLAKRFNSGKDSVKDNFGRVIRLFEQVAKEHPDQVDQITLVCADHLKKERFETTLGNVRILVIPLTANVASYYQEVRAELKRGNYNFVYATSHPLFGCIGLLLSFLEKIPLGYDIQDDYASYTRNPLLLLMNRWAVKRAAVVSCASYVLEDQVKAFAHRTVVLPNGFDPKICRPLDQKKCRKKLGLPQEAPIISYTGSMEHRGIDHLLAAFHLLQKKTPNIHLLLVGSSIKRHFESQARKKEKNILFLDSMPYNELFEAVNAADVMVLPYPKNTFTQALLGPYKLVEYMACQKKIVISDAGEMHKLAPQFVFKAGNTQSMAEKIGEAIRYPKQEIAYGEQLKELSWKALGKKLARSLQQAEQERAKK